MGAIGAGASKPANPPANLTLGGTKIQPQDRNDEIINKSDDKSKAISKDVVTPGNQDSNRASLSKIKDPN